MRTLMRQSDDFPLFYWLGLTDIANEGQYVWESDNSIASDIDWAEGFPLARDGEDCVRRCSDGWCDRKCSAQLYIVCQMRE